MILILLLIIGGLAIFFHQKIYHFFKPPLVKRDLLLEKKKVLLYFTDNDEEYLIGEKREILKKDQASDEAKEMIIELIKGPKEKLIPTLPPKTKLLTLQITQEGVAKVNFNQAFSKDHPGGSSAEMMTIYSIVNSLAYNFPQIKRVQILIEGKPIETIKGHLSLKTPISPKPDLIRRK